MSIDELAAICKIMSKPGTIFIIRCLIKHGMMTNKQIIKKYGKNIPDSLFTELLALKVISISKYGVFALDKGVDDFAFILSELNLTNSQREKLPSIINYTPVMGFFVTEEYDKVYILHSPKGAVLSKHVAKYRAVKAQVEAVKVHRQSLINKKNRKIRQKKKSAKKKRLAILIPNNSVKDEDVEWLELRKEWLDQQKMIQLQQDQIEDCENAAYY